MSVYVVTANVKPEDIIGLSISPQSILLLAGQEMPLRSFLIYGDGSKKEVPSSWSTDDNKIAKIEGSKVISAGDLGLASITASHTLSDGTIITDKVSVNVINGSLSNDTIIDLEILPSTLYLKKNKEHTFKAYSVTEHGVKQEVNAKWTVTETAVATFDTSNELTTSNSGVTDVLASYELPDGRKVTAHARLIVADDSNDKKAVGLEVFPDYLVAFEGETPSLETFVILGNGTKSNWITANSIAREPS